MNVPELTPRKRLSIYTQTLRLLKKDHSPYMCDLINDVTECEGILVRFNRHSNRLFPQLTEFNLFKPTKYVDQNISSWLPREDKKTREIILLFCIQMIKNPIK